MNAIVRKEIRLQLPVWSAGLALSVAPSLVIAAFSSPWTDPAIWSELPFAIGSLLLTVAPLEREMSAGTFALLMMQPISRARIWKIKIAVLGAALVLLWLALNVTFAASLHFRLVTLGSEEWHLFIYRTALMSVVFFTGGLWMTLLLRQVVAALWCTVLLPAAIVYAAGWLPSHMQSPSLVAALLLYSVVALFAARRHFLSAQDMPWTGGTIMMPGWLRWRARASSSASRRGKGPLRALVRKETQLHHVSAMVAFSVLALQGVSVLLRAVRPGQLIPHCSVTALDLAGLCWFLLLLALPLLLGSTVVAEERKLETLHAALCLPVSHRVQFSLKVATTLLVGVLLCAVMPWTVESIALSAGLKSSAFATAFDLNTLGAGCLIAAVLMMISIYASSLTQTTLHALSAAIVFVLSFAMMLGCSALALGPLSLRAASIEVPTLALVMSGLSFDNYRRVEIGSRTWARNVLVIAASWLAVVCVTFLSGIYTNR